MNETKYDLDEIVNRKNTCSVKWDGTDNFFQKENLLPMWVADMDFLSPSPIIEAIIHRAKHGVYGYTFIPQTYYQAIINWFQRRHNWTIHKDWIYHVPGVLPGISFAVQAFSKPGDKIIVQNPIYTPFYSIIKNNGCKKLLNPLKLLNGRYTMDFKDFKKKAEDPRSRFMILCNPHNPTGRVWTREELTTLGEICLENQILIISDEIHCDIVYPGYKYVPFSSISKEFEQNSITCTAPSKTFNLPSLKVANVIIPNPSLRTQYNKIRKRNHMTSPNYFVSAVTEAAYNKCEDWLEQLILYIKDNLNFLKNFIQTNLPEVKVIEPEGTYLVWLDFRELGLGSKEISNFLFDKAKVALWEGSLFGKGGKGFERINIACPRSILSEGLNRIAKAIKN
ncbi:MAG: pyridoxal phosphate-dependent aminotransferase [Promethearchaeota archaeon]|nr:MAG: pyridoxal phosphate-dependent aminotransferase [Candidatus Lokiarchaeota archaeon]